MMLTSVVDCEFSDLFVEVQRPIQICVDGVVVDAADGDQIELILVSYQKGVNRNLLQIEQSAVALHHPIVVSLHFTESPNLRLTFTVFGEVLDFAELRFARLDE